jgi:hypothetical protein
MTRSLNNTLLVVAIQVIGGTLLAGTSRGYTLTDWMRLWPRQNAVVAAPAAAPLQPGTILPPQITLPPSTAPGVGSYGACGSPLPTCGGQPQAYVAPNCGSAPLAYDCSSRAAVAPVSALPATTTVGYPQHVQYRLSWVRVPTTNYCPVNAFDPAAGGMTTTLRPCTTYTWQLRQVPHLTLRSPLSLPQTFVPAAVTTNYAPATILPTAAWAPVTANCPNCNPTGTSAPYYAPAAPSQPAYAPAIPSLGGPTSGLGTYGAPNSYGVPSASQGPSLSPADLQHLQPSLNAPTIRNYPPAANDPAAGANPNSTPAGQSPAGEPAKKLDLKPVPDPEAVRRDMPTVFPAIPNLIDPADQTTQRPVRMIWSYAPIVWPEVAQVANLEPATVPISSPVVPTTITSEPARASTGGWQSVTQ